MKTLHAIVAVSLLAVAVEGVRHKLLPTVAQGDLRVASLQLIVAPGRYAMGDLYDVRLVARNKAGQIVPYRTTSCTMWFGTAGATGWGGTPPYEGYRFIVNQSVDQVIGVQDRATKVKTTVSIRQYGIFTGLWRVEYFWGLNSKSEALLDLTQFKQAITGTSTIYGPYGSRYVESVSATTSKGSRTASIEGVGKFQNAVPAACGAVGTTPIGPCRHMRLNCSAAGTSDGLQLWGTLYTPPTPFYNVSYVLLHR